MTFYLDSSAIVKMVRREKESTPLRRFLKRHRAEVRTTSSLARVEVVRAVAPGGPAAITRARYQLSLLRQLPLDRQMLDDAATLSPGSGLRSLDAIHLASARLLGADLRAVVTYDGRMADAALALGLPVEAPA